jgi:hypothetical protein
MFLNFNILIIMGKIFIGIKGEDFIGAGQELRHN